MERAAVFFASLPGFAGPLMDSIMKGDRFVQIAAAGDELYARSSASVGTAILRQAPAASTLRGPHT